MIIFLALEYKLNQPKNYYNYLIISEPKDIQVYNFYNKIYLTAVADSGLYYMTLDTTDTILADEYLPLNTIKINGQTFQDGIFYIAGSKILQDNSRIPALLLLYKTYYEPYYDVEFTGSYLNVCVENNKLYLLKKSFLNDTLQIIRRLLDMSLDKKLKFYSPPIGTRKLLKMKILDKNIILASSNKNSKTITIKALDTINAKQTWQYTFKYLQPRINPKTIVKNHNKLYIASLNNNKSLVIRIFSQNGLESSLKIALPQETDNIQSLLIDSNSYYVLLQTLKYNYILKLSTDGKIIWSQRLAPTKSIWFYDMTKLPNNQLWIVGSSYNKTLSMLNQIDIFELKTLKINAKTGDYPKLTLWQLFVEYLHHKKTATTKK